MALSTDPFTCDNLEYLNRGQHLEYLNRGQHGDHHGTAGRVTFQKDVVAAALQIELDEALGAGRAALDFPTGSGDTAAVSAADIDKAKQHAEALIKQESVLERLCPTLRTVSGDLGAVAKVITPTLLPLAIGPHALIPLTPLAFGALAFVVVRAGVSAICPDKSK
jgi:hypothetical protein